MVVRDRKLKDRQYNDQMTKGQTMIYNDRTVIYACGLNFCRFLIGYQNYSDDLVFFVFHLIVVKTAYYKKYTY
jgi:hypothetical protein